MKEQCDFKMEIGVINNKFSVLVDIIKIWIKYICDKFSPPTGRTTTLTTSKVKNPQIL